MVREVTAVNENVITPHRIKLRSSPLSKGPLQEEGSKMSPARVRPSKKYRRRKRLTPKKTDKNKSLNDADADFAISAKTSQNGLDKYLESKCNSITEKDCENGYNTDNYNNPIDDVKGNDICGNENGNENGNDLVMIKNRKKTVKRGALKNANVNSPKTRAKPIKSVGGIDSHKLTEYFDIEKTVSVVSPKVLAKTLKSPVKPNHKLTEYYPVRRSVRKTSKCVQAERIKDLEIAIREEREHGLEICVFEEKGRGVVATHHFRRGDFVVEYAGTLVDSIEARRREEAYSKDPKAGCYMYYFKHGNRQFCIDATPESGRLGRLVNHSRNGNLHTKVVFVDGVPHLVLLASQDINPGEELTYDYGDRSKESLTHHPWLAL